MAFCDGHNAAFAFFGGVPRSILYDNTKLVVARILGDGKRQRTRVFTELQSHYLFEDRFGRPGKGNDKGKVEGLVGFIRRNFLVPVPRAESFAALNDALAEQCRRRQLKRVQPVDDLLHQIPHRIVSKMRDLGPWDLPPVRVDDHDIRIVARSGDGRQPGVDVLDHGVADAHHGHGLGQMGGDAFFVVFIHRRV